MAETAVGPDGRSNTEHASAGAAQRAEQALRAFTAVERATLRLWEEALALNETSVHQPSLLPGWSRAHVLSHLARNADGYVNLLRWARTGVEHPMYTSTADRDADIEEGSVRGHRLILEDLAAACERLAVAVRALPTTAWTTEVAGEAGTPMPSDGIPRARLLEVWAHLVDLDHGFGFEDIPEVDAEALLTDAVQQLAGRQDVPAVSVSVRFGDRTRDWELRGTTTRAARVHGSPGAVLGWLLGRTEGQHLSGDVPALPIWL